MGLTRVGKCRGGRSRGQLALGNGQPALGNGQPALGNGRPALGNGQLALQDRGQLCALSDKVWEEAQGTFAFNYETLFSLYLGPWSLEPWSY